MPSLICLGNDNLDAQQQSIGKAKEDLQALQKARENEETKLAEMQNLVARLAGKCLYNASSYYIRIQRPRRWGALWRPEDTPLTTRPARPSFCSGSARP